MTEEFFQLQDESKTTKFVCQNCLKNLFVCKQCGEPITSAYFLGNDLLLHVHCLKNIKVNSFFFKKINLKNKKCASCSKSIQTQSFVTTENGRIYHPGSKFSFLHFFSKIFFFLACIPHCKICHGVISSKCVFANPHYYHQDCFKCSKCGGCLSNQYFHQNDLLSCLNCNQILKCDSCKKNLEGEYLTF